MKFGKPIYKHTSISDSALRLFLQSSAGLRYLGLTEWFVIFVDLFCFVLFRFVLFCFWTIHYSFPFFFFNSLVLSVQCFPDNYFYPNLRTLDLSFCPQIQDEIIQKITENAPFLTRLCINNLNLISQARFLSNCCLFLLVFNLNNEIVIINVFFFFFFFFFSVWSPFLKTVGFYKKLK